MTRLAVLLDVQTRLDDGTATAADRKAVAELDDMLRPTAARILAGLLARRDADRAAQQGKDSDNDESTEEG